jgi:hypothetical protein
MRDANVSSMPCAKEYCVNAKGVVGGRAADHAGDAAVLTRLLISNRPLATGCALHPHVPLRMLTEDDLVSSWVDDQVMAAGCAVPASVADQL